MALFMHRPLAFATLLLLPSVALIFLLPLWAGIVLTALLLVTAVISIFLSVRGKIRFLLPLVLVVCLLGAGRATIGRAGTAVLLESRFGQTLQAELVVEEISYRGNYGSEAVARVVSLQGRACRVRVILRTEGLSPYYIGDRIVGDFLCESLSYDSYYEGVERTYLGRNAHAVFLPISTSLQESGSNSLAARLADFRAMLAFRIQKALPGKGGELLSAVLLGDSEALGEDVVRDFRRIGISHLLAISGLHLSVLCGALDALLKLFRADKRLRLLATLLLSVLYFILTGGAISVLRAAAMLLFVRLSFFLRTDNDPFTALSVSAAVLVLLTPTLVFNLSFLLTVLATLGILGFNGVEGLLFAKARPKKKIAKLGLFLLRKLTASLLITLSAGIAVLPVQWLVFGEVSLLTPLSNLIFVPLALPLLLCALLLLVSSILPMLAVALSYPIGLFCDLVLFMSGRLSLPDCVISLRYAFVPFVLLPFLALTLGLLCAELGRRRYLLAAPLLAAALAFCICLGVTNHTTQAAPDLLYHRDGNNEALGMVQGGESLLIDLSGGGYSHLLAAYRALGTFGTTELDLLAYTHYHSGMPMALTRFAKNVRLRSVLLPNPQTPDDAAILDEMLAVLTEYEIEYALYRAEETVTVLGGVGLTPSAHLYHERSTEPAYTLTLSLGGRHLRYESGAYREYAGPQYAAASGFEYFILGAHGPIPKQVVALHTLPPTRYIFVTEQEIVDHISWSGVGSIVLFPEKYIFRWGAE